MNIRKEASIFGITVVISLVVAAIGHAVHPPFCMAVKPMFWPFAVLAVRGALALRRKAKEERRPTED